MKQEVFKCVVLDKTQGRYSHLQQHFQIFDKYYRCKPDFFFSGKGQSKTEHYVGISGCIEIIFIFKISNTLHNQGHSKTEQDVKPKNLILRMLH